MVSDRENMPVGDGLDKERLLAEKKFNERRRVEEQIIAQDRIDPTRLTLMQRIIVTDFDGYYPGLEQIIAHFPPKTETFVAHDGAEFSREVSRSSNRLEDVNGIMTEVRGSILFIAPPAVK